MVDPLVDDSDCWRARGGAPGAQPQDADVSTTPPQPPGPPSCLQFDQPENQVAVYFGRAAHRHETVDNGRLKPNQPFALCVCPRFVADVAERERGGYRAGVMAMRIIGVAIGRGFEGEGPHSLNFSSDGSARGPRSRSTVSATLVDPNNSVIFRVLTGAARGIRTPDPLITNEVLYQLSYCGAAIEPAWGRSIGAAVYADFGGFGNISVRESSRAEAARAEPGRGSMAAARIAARCRLERLIAAAPSCG
jgi:hypothetical protein